MASMTNLTHLTKTLNRIMRKAKTIRALRAPSNKEMGSFPSKIRRMAPKWVKTGATRMVLVGVGAKARARARKVA